MRTICQNTFHFPRVTPIYGMDPYNTVDAPAMANRVVANFHGPLGALAYRSQRDWDFIPASVQGEARFDAWRTLRGMGR